MDHGTDSFWDRPGLGWLQLFSAPTDWTCQDGWNAQKLKEHMETYLQKKASESESEATGGAGW